MKLRLVVLLLAFPLVLAASPNEEPLTIDPTTPIVGEPFVATYHPLVDPKGKYKRVTEAAWNHIICLEAGQRAGHPHAEAYQRPPYDDVDGVYEITLVASEFAVPGETLDCTLGIGVSDGSRNIDYDSIRIHPVVPS